MSDLKLPLSRRSSGNELQITSSREKLLEELRDARGVDQAFEEKMDKVSEIERHILEQATPGFTPCKFSHDVCNALLSPSCPSSNSSIAYNSLRRSFV